ncbi:MAG TPA: YigZ family protein [Candidatus Anaerofilum excrementigallinarum]|nr:YigZ family protein [Candidatus Anaerofilum excrementigallinarum]
MQDYTTVRGTASAEIEEKHSRFIASVSFADTEQAALDFLASVRAQHRTARHNVYAYVLREGNRTRYSDDGEPAKTAGLPVLEAIQHAGVTDCVVVVTRYFGGILLGTGGLVRAYTASAAAGLAAAEIVTVRSCVSVEITVEYSLYERAALLFQQAGARLEEPVFSDKVFLRGIMPAGSEGGLLPALQQLTRGGQAKVSDPFYLPF